MLYFAKKLINCTRKIKVQIGKYTENNFKKTFQSFSTENSFETNLEELLQKIL
ncbi:hypothetical protein Fmac_019195 [Flemingia macrophylla]|uniref:Ribosomal protein S16 n=1 Tax=Flemingia macrophylla TaxID=520843 RepID=A0ABD1M750_9FABA